MNQGGDPLGSFIPGEMHVRASGFFEVQSFSVIPFITASRAGQGVGTSADAIFVLEKIYLLLVGMAFL